MNSIYAITTHHDKPSDAAEAWRELNVCAIGFRRYGVLTKGKLEDLSKDAQLFLKIKKGDLILAYAMGNRSPMSVRLKMENPITLGSHCRS